MIIGVRGTIRAEGIHQILPRLIIEMVKRNIEPLIAYELIDLGNFTSADLPDLIDENVLPQSRLSEKADMIMTLGGDGSMLEAVHELKRDVPILGLHMGSVGYLTTTTPDHLQECLDDLIEGRLVEDRRTMLHVVAECDGYHIEADALNDVVITSSLPGRVIRLSTRLNNERLFQVTGDGLIHATPTGSTAYNISGGGPVLDPTMSAILLTPIMAHSISVRPIVVGPDSVIETTFQSRSGGMLLAIDGWGNKELTPSARITVSQSKRTVRLMKSSQPGFIQVLRDKLFWNLEDK
jgi:NAD+ kinase